MASKRYIKSSPIFFIAIFVFIVLRLHWYCLILLGITIVHELGHILMAFVFRCKISGINLIPIGEIVDIHGLDKISAVKRFLVMVSGSVLNVIFGLVLLNVQSDSQYIDFAITASYIIAGLNMLPVYPFDGGRILYLILGNTVGIINSGNALAVLNKIFYAIFVLVGVIQTILYPYNLSLLAIGLMVSHLNKNEASNRVYHFYKTIMLKRKRQMLPAKVIIIAEDLPLKKIVKKICWDNYLLLVVNKNILTETTLTDYILENGDSAMLSDVLKCKFNMESVLQM